MSILLSNHTSIIMCVSRYSSPAAKKALSMVEAGGESEVYGHGDSLLRERLQRAEEVSHGWSSCDL